MTFFLDKNATREELTDAVNYLLANFTQAKQINPNSGEVTAQTTGISGYLYRYLSLKYADSWDGKVNFSNSPTNRSYYGIYNSQSVVEPFDPANYLWTKVSGGFGTTKFLWYSVNGGRQIQIIVDSSKPYANYVPDSGFAIDLDLLTNITIDDMTPSIDVVGVINNIIDQTQYAPKPQDAIVGLSLPSELSTSNPIVNVGTLSATWASQTANKVFASPNGSPGTPSFRALVSADIPSLSYAPATSGTSILYGNGSGGFSNVTVGSNLTFSGGTLNATGGGSGSVTSVSALTLGTTGTDLSSSVVNSTTTPVITLNVPTASSTNRGVLSAADWATFNGKQPAGSYLVSGGALGTPSSGTATNLTGTASGLTAGNVTTNANLTGPITSVGNATAITNSAVTYSKIQNVSTTQRVLGRISAGAGVVEELTGTNVKSFLGLTANDIAIGVDPIDYGAVCDGVTDDTTAFQNAAATGKNVLLTKGPIKVTGSINIATDGQKIISMNPGAVVTPVGNFDLFTFNGAKEGCGLKGLRIAAAGMTGGRVIYVNDSHRITFSDLIVWDSFNFAYITKCNTSTIENCWIPNIRGTYGIQWFGNATQRSDILKLIAVVLGCNSTARPTGILWDGNCNSLSLQSVGIITPGIGVQIKDSSGGGLPYFLMADDLEIDYPSNHAVSLEAGSDFYFNPALYLHGSTTGSGIYITSSVPSDTVTVTGGKISGHARYGIERQSAIGSFIGANVSFSFNTLGNVLGLMHSLSQRFELDTYNYITLSSGNPLHSYDNNDYTAYDRTNNVLANFIGGTAITSVNSTGYSVTGTITSSSWMQSPQYFVDTYSYWTLTSGNPILGFDTTDYLTYNRATNSLDTFIAANKISSVTAAGLSITGTINGNTITTGSTSGTNTGDNAVNSSSATALQGANADAFRVDEDVYGFLNQTETTLSFNDGTNVFTVAPVASTWSYYRTGVKCTITGSKTITLPASSSTTTLYFIFIDANDGTLTQSTTPWTLNDTKVLVATVSRNSTLTPAYFISEERHTCKWLRRDHMYEHYTEGTRYSGGGAVTGPTVGSSTNSQKTCAVAIANFFDEDIYEATQAITAGNGSTDAFYSVFYRTGASAWSWQRSVMPFKYSGAGAIQYDNAGTMTVAGAGSGSNTRWVNYYLALTNVSGQESIAWIPGRAAFTSLAAAQSEDFSTFSITGFPCAELVAIWKFTWDTNGSGLGLCRLAQAAVRINSNIINSTGSIAGVHNALSGLQGGTTGEYYHATASEYTGTGTGNFVRETSPTLVTPLLGTPTSGNLVNCTGYTGTSALVTTGALNAGSITSGFGSIDIGNDIVIAGAYNVDPTSFFSYNSGNPVLAFDTNDYLGYNRTTNILTAYIGGNAIVNISSSGVSAITKTGPVTKTADFTLAATDDYVINNKTGSTCTVTLPTASTCSGREVTFKNMQAFTLVSASSNVVPIDSTTAGTSILAGIIGNWATIVSDGTNWITMQQAPNNILLLE